MTVVTLLWRNGMLSLWSDFVVVSIFSLYSEYETRAWQKFAMRGSLLCQIYVH